LRRRMKRESELRQFFLYDIVLDRHEFGVPEARFVASRSVFTAWSL
jgi:hypothetical protein